MWASWVSKFLSTLYAVSVSGKTSLNCRGEKYGLMEMAMRKFYLELFSAV